MVATRRNATGSGLRSRRSRPGHQCLLEVVAALHRRLRTLTATVDVQRLKGRRAVWMHDL